MVRLKTRYLVVEVTGAVNARKLVIQKEDITTLIKESIAKSYGDFGVGMSQYAFQVVYFNKHTRLAAVRCAREQCKMVETSLVFVTDHQSQDIRVRVVRVCGSSRTCRQHLLSLSIERGEEFKLKAAYPKFPAELEEEIAAIDQ